MGVSPLVVWSDRQSNLALPGSLRTLLALPSHCTIQSLSKKHCQRKSLMADQYLLRCPSCDQDITIGLPQAGSLVMCPCGQKVEVPTLRALRQLPKAAPTKGEARPVWGFRHGLIALAMILATLCAIPGVYWRVAQSTTEPYSLEAQLNHVMERLDKASPSQTWEYWHTVIVPLSERGLTEFVTSDSIAYDRKMKSLTLYQTISFGLSGSFALLAVVVALWRSG